jgi:hypothetical protein
MSNVRKLAMQWQLQFASLNLIWNPNEARFAARLEQLDRERTGSWLVFLIEFPKSWIGAQRVPKRIKLQ